MALETRRVVRRCARVFGELRELRDVAQSVPLRGGLIGTFHLQSLSLPSPIRRKIIWTPRAHARLVAFFGKRRNAVRTRIASC